ncbi:hypothetical protein C0Z17_04895 [Trinickia caryophylli]|nr:hypothetical protein C0Z17_04895 [Trinickia caryophylli]
MPAFVLTLVAIPVTFVWAVQSNPFFSFSSFILPFVVPLGALIRLSMTTRAKFFEEHFEVQHTQVFYRDIIRADRGRFTLTIRYRRHNDAPNAKPRRIKLPFAEMRSTEQQQCLAILRTHATAETVSGLQG